MRDPLIVFDAQETSFTSNGLRILSPTVAEHTLEMNQAGSIHVEHPIDKDGDWKSLLNHNIILAPCEYRGQICPQPFRIFRTQKKRQGNTASIAVDALHMFYDLNYAVLEDVRPTDLTCLQAIAWVMERPYNPSGRSVLPTPNFRYYSDIDKLSTAYYQWKTITGALIGEDNSILNRWGGELFVNGLYFSICKKMEGSRENAFHIAYGCDLIELEEIIDTTNTYSQLVAEDNYGNSTHGSVPIWYTGQPFEKTLYAKFSYSDELTAQERGTRFGSDFGRYMGMIQSADVSYKARFADLRADSPFHELAHHEVGDSGIIEDTELDILTTQRIMKKVTNLLTGEAISVETGNLARSTTRRKPFQNTVTVGETAAQKQMQTISGQVSSLGEQVSELEWFSSVPTPIAANTKKLLTTSGGKFILYKR